MSPTAFAREELARAHILGPTAVTIGKFDGVHRGHRYLIGRLLEESTGEGCSSVIVTFNPQPAAVLNPESPAMYLCPLEERVERLRDLGVDSVAVISFTSQLAQLSARDFLSLLAEELELKLLLVGPDFALGRRRDGNIDRIREIGSELGFRLVVVPLLAEEDKKVGSAAIRSALATGDMETVTDLLGRPFSLSGPVVVGSRRGRTIGFPTANVGVSADLAVPAHGVYVTRAHLKGSAHPSVTNIGVRPTFDDVPRLTVEAYLLDFKGDIYGQDMRLDLLHCLRLERKFESVEELIAAIGRDVQATRDYFDAGR